MKSLYFYAVIFFINFLSADMERVDIFHDNEARHYLKYIPSEYDKNIPINLVIGLHGYTGSASGFEKETTGGFNLSAEKYNFISVYPQGSYFYEESFFQGNVVSSYVSSWNDLTGSKTKTPEGETCAVDAVHYPKYPNCIGSGAGRCAWTSCGDDIGFIKHVIDDLKEKYLINKLYVVGMSNGGKMAHALACIYPDLIDGVINVVGSPQLGLGCKPKGPINYIIYSGLKDNIVPPFDVVSFDGYYYTPMTTIVNKWKDEFGCKSKKIIKHNTPDNIEENIYLDCYKDVKIISLLNLNEGHSWPGSEDSNAGYCRSNDQKEISIDDCVIKTNIWGNDFLLERLFL